MKLSQFREHLLISKSSAGIRRGMFAAAALFFAIGVTIPANAQVIIYNSLQTPTGGTPTGSASLQAIGINEIGDGVIFIPSTARQPTAVRVELASFACQTGRFEIPAGAANACVTTPGSTFNQAVTLRIYAVNANLTPGPLLETVTQTFAIPFRPSNEARCAAFNATPGTGYLNPVDGICENGLGTLINFDLTGLAVPLPDRVIITVSYNTTNYGFAPVGTGAACFATATGCPYDSLNVATDVVAPSVGALIDPLGVYVNYGFPNACNPAAPLNVLMDDTPCNGGQHLEIRVDAIVPTPGVFQVHYLSNLNIGDGVINITNTGALGALGLPAASGNICVNVYAFSPDEQEVSCCSCLLTPNALASLSARNDLISNTLTPQVPTSLVVKLVPSVPGTAAVPGNIGGPLTGTVCNAGLPLAPINLAPGLAAFATNLHLTPTGPQPAGTYGLTETPFTRATLSTAELTRITTLCSFNQTNGSGFGICRTCRLGGLGVERQ